MQPCEQHYTVPLSSKNLGFHFDSSVPPSHVMISSDGTFLQTKTWNDIQSFSFTGPDLRTAIGLTLRSLFFVFCLFNVAFTTEQML